MERKLSIIAELEVLLPQLKELSDKVSALKEELKPLSSENEVLGNISILHKVRNTVNYAKYVKDNNIAIPDSYNTSTPYIEVKLLKEKNS